MMHERGTSDSVIVAVKPANKAERSATELVERRAGAKGNVERQGTPRTPSRIGVRKCCATYGTAAISSLLSSSEVGAVCGKAARTDLCGGRSAINVPTATVARAPRNDGRGAAGALHLAAP